MSISRRHFENLGMDQCHLKYRTKMGGGEKVSDLVEKEVMSVQKDNESNIFTPHLVSIYPYWTKITPNMVSMSSPLIFGCWTLDDKGTGMIDRNSFLFIKFKLTITLADVSR